MRSEFSDVDGAVELGDFFGRQLLEPSSNARDLSLAIGTQIAHVLAEVGTPEVQAGFLNSALKAAAEVINKRV